MTNFEKVKKFMQTFGQEIKENAEFPSERITKLRTDLIDEELEAIGLRWVEINEWVQNLSE